MRYVLRATLLALASLLLSYLTIAQTKLGTIKVRKAGETYRLLEQDSTDILLESMPVFPGGEDSLYRFVYSTMRYPQQAKRQRISGTVYMQYIVDEAGQISDIKVYKGAHRLLDAEALRIAEQLPPYEQPAKQGNLPIAVQVMLPIRFELE